MGARVRIEVVRLAEQAARLRKIARVELPHRARDQLAILGRFALFARVVGAHGRRAEGVTDPNANHEQDGERELSASAALHATSVHRHVYHALQRVATSLAVSRGRSRERVQTRNYPLTPPQRSFVTRKATRRPCVVHDQ
jgi:hypothetical protein